MQCLTKSRVVLRTCKQGLTHGQPCHRQVIVSNASKDGTPPSEAKPRARRASSKAAKRVEADDDGDEQPVVKPRRASSRQAKSKEPSAEDVPAEPVKQEASTSSQPNPPVQHMGFSLANIRENAMRFFRGPQPPPSSTPDHSKQSTSSSQAIAEQTAAKTKEPRAQPAAAKQQVQPAAASSRGSSESGKVADKPREASTKPAAVKRAASSQPAAAKARDVSSPPAAVKQREPSSQPAAAKPRASSSQPSVPPPREAISQAAPTKLQAVQAAAKQASASALQGVAVRKQAPEDPTSSKLTVKQKFISVKEVLGAAKSLSVNDLSALKTRIDELKEGIDDLYYDATSDPGPAELKHLDIKFSMQQQGPELDLLNQLVEEKVLVSCTVNGVKVTGQATNTSFFNLDGSYDRRQSCQSFRLGPLVVAYDLATQKEVCGGLEELRVMWGVSADELCRLIGWILNNQLECLMTQTLDERLSYHYADYVPYTWYNFKY